MVWPLVLAALLTPCKATQFHASWINSDARSSAESLTVVWKGETGCMSALQARFCAAAGGSPCAVVEGVMRESGTQNGSLWQATANSLKPSTPYKIQVMEKSGQWSKEAFEVRTAPSPTEEDQSFSFVFVGDTGLIGRDDGLTNATKRVISLIGDMDPLMVLLGGDMAYSDNDHRFSNSEDGIDFFFQEIQTFARKTVLMPTYGNHERYEGIESWKQRFALPKGLDGDDTGVFYSFTVGSVRFISIAGPKCKNGLVDGSIDWIKDELVAAQNDPNIKWTIPYFHVSPFANGHSHPSNMNLRQELLEMFTSHGVRLVLNAHDQNYERTYPVLPNDSLKEHYQFAMEKQDNIKCYDENTAGTIFIKASPGGKLSNHGGSFSRFRGNHPGAYTAVGDDRHHHILNVKVSKDGNELSIKCIGVKDSNAKEIVVDSFRYTLSENCSGRSETHSSKRKMEVLKKQRVLQY